MPSSTPGSDFLITNPVIGRSAVSVAGAAASINGGVNQQLERGVAVYAETAPVPNTEVVYVGFTGVTILTGTPLSPGQGIFIEVDDLSKIFFIDSGGGGQFVRWIGG